MRDGDQGIDIVNAEIARGALRSTGNGLGAGIQVLTPAELAARPRPLWLVREVLPERGLAVIYGASGAGKTFVVLDLACAMVRGVRWFGRRVRQGRVIYAATEGALGLRLEAYCDTHGVTMQDDLRGLGVVEQALDLRSDHGDVDELVLAVQAHMRHHGWETVDAVIVDTLNRAMPGGNENASEDMGRMVQAAQRLGGELEALVIYVHHAGKDETRGSRGHSSLKAASDAEIAVNRSGDVRVIHAEKVREARDSVDVGAFQLEWVDLGAASAHDPQADADERVGSCVLAPCEVPEGKAEGLTGPASLALQYLHAVLDTEGEIPPREVVLKAGKRGPKSGQTACREGAWRDYAVEAGGLANSDKRATHRQAWGRAREKLETCAIVGCYGGWVWLRDKRDKARH